MNKEQIYLLIGTIISWSLGPIGADRIYKGQYGLGLLKLVTLGGLLVWYLIDAFDWTRDLGKSLGAKK